ncbi:MAG: pre-peptidase C-terminal domain-containing protein [Pirellulaceae bacterium]|nr:pre-peptidase C-terminal domain-containing protein [Pirellulaceae bacterium]
MNRLVALLSLLAVGVWPSLSAWAQPSLTRAVPTAVVPGQTTAVTLYGAKLQGAARIWTSFPAELQLEPGGDASHVVCKVTLPATAAPGFGGLIISTPAGASDPLLLAIDDLPAVVDDGKNHQAETAQALTWPVAVDGVADAARMDWYRIEGKAGQRVAVEVVARRLDSSLDPVLRLLDEQGQELRLSDDEPGLGADSRFEFTFPKDGAYLLQLQDNKYEGGGFYRLRVGDFPLLATPYPLGVRRGSTTRVQVGWLPDQVPAHTLVQVPDVAAGGVLGVAARLPGGSSSALATLLVSDGPEVRETERPVTASADPAAGQAAAAVSSTDGGQPVELPTAVNGRLREAGERDVYAFPALKGQQLTLRVVAGRLGSPAVPRLTIQAADGKTLAETSFSEVSDQTLNYSVPADGTYRLVVDELLGRGGPDYTYRVELGYARPFTLSLKNDKATLLSLLTAQGNGAVPIEVQCQRAGYDGPIQLALEDPETGLKLYEGLVAEKANAGRLLLAVPPDSQPGDLRVIRLVGTAVVAGRQVTELVSTAALVTARRPRLGYPPAWTDGLLTVTTGPGPAAPPFTASWEPADIRLARPLGDTVAALKLERTNKEYKEPLQFVVGDLPRGFSAEVKREGEGDQQPERYLVTIKSPAGPPLLVSPIRVTALTTFKGQGFAVDLPATLHVLEPLAVELTAAGPLEPGKTLSLTAKIRRAGDEPQAVVVRLPNLPAGVTGPAELSLATDQSEVQFELSAAADAAVANHPLVCTAATTFQGRDVQVESPPIELQIKQP